MNPILMDSDIIFVIKNLLAEILEVDIITVPDFPGDLTDPPTVIVKGVHYLVKQKPEAFSPEMALESGEEPLSLEWKPWKTAGCSPPSPTNLPAAVANDEANAPRPPLRICKQLPMTMFPTLPFEFESSSTVDDEDSSPPPTLPCKSGLKRWFIMKEKR
nr:hypothetical protein Iba_chr08bCG9490 [Ipomoea batatas]